MFVQILTLNKLILFLLTFNNFCHSLLFQIFIKNNWIQLRLPGHDQIEDADAIGNLSLLILQCHLLFHFFSFLNKVHAINWTFSFLPTLLFIDSISTCYKRFGHCLPIFETHLNLPLIQYNFLAFLLILLLVSILV